MFATVADRTGIQGSDNHGTGGSEANFSMALKKPKSASLSGSNAWNDPRRQHGDPNRSDAEQTPFESSLKSQRDQQSECGLANHAAGDENEGRLQDLQQSVIC
jgi:hypothetical protein